MQSELASLTVLIPLYRSQRFSAIVDETISSHVAAGAQVILSDRHQLDTYAAQLSARYCNHNQVRVICAKDALSWVDNINLLMQEVKTPFFRILPHDDSTTVIASQALVQALIDNEDKILATGFIRAIDIDNKRLSDRDRMYPMPAYVRQSWSIEKALDLFFSGFYPGAFKGVIRTEQIKKHSLTIIPTPTLIDAERCWLFALHLIADFCFVEMDTLYKRHYADSTHRQWTRSAQNPLHNAEVLIAYCKQVLDDQSLRMMAEKHIHQNSFIRYQQHNQGVKYSPPYYNNYLSVLPDESHA
jgi:hypothetical protein